MEWGLCGGAGTQQGRHSEISTVPIHGSLKQGLVICTAVPSCSSCIIMLQREAYVFPAGSLLSSMCGFSFPNYPTYWEPKYMEWVIGHYQTIVLHFVL
jgi:hypothetical protein